MYAISYFASRARLVVRVSTSSPRPGGRRRTRTRKCATSPTSFFADHARIDDGWKRAAARRQRTRVVKNELERSPRARELDRRRNRQG